MPMTLRRNVKPEGALQVVSVVFCPFSDKQTDISTIHQLLNVSASQEPPSSSGTLGNMTRQSSVCHKLSKIIDAC